MRRRSAPLATWQISPPSGSQQIAPSMPSAWPRATKSRGAGHHPLLVDEGGDDDAAGERPGTDDGVGGEQHRRHAGLHVGRAAPVDPAVAQLGAERVDASTSAGRPR